MDENKKIKYLSCKDYAEKVGVSPQTVKIKCLGGRLPGAIKVANRWLIPEDTPWVDLRVKSGKYIGVYRKRTNEKGIPLEEYKKTHEWK